MSKKPHRQPQNILKIIKRKLSERIDEYDIGAVSANNEYEVAVYEGKREAYEDILNLIIEYE